MIVVSNTSPLNYLVLISAVDLLPQLFGSIFIPPAVQDELSDPETPDSVRKWSTHPPAWLHVERIEPDSGGTRRVA